MLNCHMLIMNLYKRNDQKSYLWCVKCTFLFAVIGKQQNHQFGPASARCVQESLVGRS